MPTDEDIFNMLESERREVLDQFLDEDDLRFKLMEIADLKKQIKKIKKKIKEKNKKKELTDLMGRLNLSDHEISDGMKISLVSGTSYHRLSYSTVEKDLPHLLDELEPAISVTNRSPYVTTRFIGE